MWKHRMKNDRGSALVELALTLPLLAAIVVGAMELGRVAYYAIELTNAARAGAAYGSQTIGTAFQSDLTPIETAAQDDAPDITLSWKTAPTTACTCETIYYDGTTAPSYSPDATKPGSCTSSTITGCTVTTTTSTQVVVSYIQVAPQATIKTMFKYPGFPTSYTLSGWAQMRVLPNGD